MGGEDTEENNGCIHFLVCVISLKNREYLHRLNYWIDENVNCFFFAYLIRLTETIINVTVKRDLIY